MTCYVNKVTPILIIDSKCHNKQLQVGKSRKTCLTNHAWSISHHIVPLVINALEGEHTDTHTNEQTKVIFRNQARAGAWFKNYLTTEIQYYYDDTVKHTVMSNTSFNKVHQPFICQNP